MLLGIERVQSTEQSGIKIEIKITIRRMIREDALL